MRLDDEETCFCSPTLNVCLCKDILTGPATPKAYYHIAALAVLGLQFSPAALHPQSQQEPDQGELCRELGSNNINILLNQTDIPRTPADEPAAELTAVAPEAACTSFPGKKWRWLASIDHCRRVRPMAQEIAEQSGSMTWLFDPRWWRISSS